ncbi:uncharacterized protein LOC117118960 [Anneissia japonica]|uniref:uncharacterized protein LOC117118960 n=1 Tax=Anneissia japonica TaxID=1529436 RepID=UPI001425A1CE|nr:uncharacterized protein LOC117118960 [Anneissia japonica]
MLRKMGMKRNVFIFITIVALFTATYLTFFNHPPAEETLMANRAQSIRRPEWMEKTMEVNFVQEANAAAKDVFLLDEPKNNNIEKFDSNKKKLLEAPKNDIERIHQSAIDKTKSAAGDNKISKIADNKEKENFLPDTGGKLPKEETTLVDKHGIKFFDWDKWISDQGFVSVGKIWAFCDEPNPPVVGAAILMADENGGIKIVTVMNTTFENSILFGTIAVKVEYGGIQLYTNEFPVCDMAEEDEFFTCPMKAGDQYYMREDHVPGLLPAGNYYTEAKLIDHNKVTVVCANCDLNIK